MLKSIGSWRHSQSLLHQNHLIVSSILQLQSIGKELKTKWLAQLISTHRARRTKCAKIENKRRRSDLFLLLCRLFCVQRICFVSSSSSLLSGMVFNLTPLKSEEETFDPYSQEIELKSICELPRLKFMFQNGMLKTGSFVNIRFPFF